MAIKQVGTSPTNAVDATTKSYVDTGLASKVSTSAVGAASGVASLDGGGKVPVSQLPNTVPVRVAVPATATSTGVSGQIAFDGSFIYCCTATNTWVRAALATW